MRIVSLRKKIKGFVVLPLFTSNSLTSLCNASFIKSNMFIFVLFLCLPSGQRGIYTTSSGLQIAYLSGFYDRKEYKSSSTQDKMVRERERVSERERERDGGVCVNSFSLLSLHSLHVCETRTYNLVTSLFLPLPVPFLHTARHCFPHSGVREGGV